ncbi:MAG: ligase-associated DNA damage response endonuclease PdeM [Betaproteobacteria bacterium]|nr:ligase-associated DNA damage response endonuclease PdeM [Betaproteobacteria bacterium]
MPDTAVDALRSGTLRTELAGEAVTLLPHKAMFWPRRKTLFIADYHLGKVAAFRDAGLPLPAGTTSQAIQRLSACIAATGADHVVLLGDFLHSKAARAPKTLARFAQWRCEYSQLALTLVRGNHDDKAGDPPPDWNIRCVEEGEVLTPFLLAHHPGALVGGHALCGHIHPAVRLTEPGGTGLALPCFWLRAGYAVLPAFGEFTGSAVVRPVKGDRCFVIAGDRVLAV